jgi:hypothetical protein
MASAEGPHVVLIAHKRKVISGVSVHEANFARNELALGRRERREQLLLVSGRGTAGELTGRVQIRAIDDQINDNSLGIIDRHQIGKACFGWANFGLGIIDGAIGL